MRGILATLALAASIGSASAQCVGWGCFAEGLTGRPTPSWAPTPAPQRQPVTGYTSGNSIYLSNGVTGRRNGNFTYFSDGTTCQQIGQQLWCN